MSPQDRQKLNDLEARLKALETVRNLQFTKELQRQIKLGNITVNDGASLAGTNISVRNASDTGSTTVADDYAGAVSLYINNTYIGRIGYYA